MIIIILILILLLLLLSRSLSSIVVINRNDNNYKAFICSCVYFRWRFVLITIRFVICDFLVW